MTFATYSASSRIGVILRRLVAEAPLLLFEGNKRLDGACQPEPAPELGHRLVDRGNGEDPHNPGLSPLSYPRQRLDGSARPYQVVDYQDMLPLLDGRLREIQILHSGG